MFRDIMREILLLWILLSTLVQASGSDDHISLRYDYFDFSGSKQKDEGHRGTIHLQASQDKNRIQLAYEKSLTQTYQPPLREDLKVDKVMVRFDHKISKKEKFNLGFIMVKDNIVATDGGKVFNLGYCHKTAPGIALSGDLYYGRYDIMKTYQLDLAVKLYKDLGAFDARVNIVAKNILIDECSDAFCAKADEHYFTAGIKAKLEHQEFFLHGAAFFGKRVFAIMMDGFALQHHAMEFDQTYIVGVGKRFDDVELKLVYAHQRAKELPVDNSGVEVDSGSLKVTYYF